MEHKEWEVRYLIRGKLAANWPGGKSRIHVDLVTLSQAGSLAEVPMIFCACSSRQSIESEQPSDDASLPQGHNCIHFCSELALALGVSPVPVSLACLAHFVQSLSSC
jgi:hypothetical protein